nr:hypothetical protein [Desulfobacterales bacterium]
MTNPGKSIRVVEGTIYLWAAKGFYLLSGYIIHVFLGRFLGLGDYGVFGTILATASIFDLVVNTGVPQAVSRYLGIRESDVRAVFKTGLRCQLTICTVLSLAFLVCAKLLAGWVLNDHSLTPYFRLLAISFIPVGLLRLYTSALLGVHEYFKASVLYSVESFFRLCLVVILVLMGWRVFGAIWGYVLAAVLPLVWAHWSYDFKETESKRTIGARTLLAFSLPLIIFAGLSSLFLNVGTLMVKGLLRADRAVGLYVAASVLANAPYHLFGSIRGVLMPALSYADGGESVELIKKYIGKGLRVMVFF